MRISLEGSGKDALHRCFAEIVKSKHGAEVRIGMSAYTCPDVAVAAIKAGCRIVPLDIDARTLDIGGSIDTSACDVLLLSNLYGLADDLQRWEEHNLLIVDDACQAALSRDGDDACQAALSRDGDDACQAALSRDGDDACQAALSRSGDGGALLGARGGDYGVLSFSRGKAICGLGGGVLLRPKEAADDSSIVGEGSDDLGSLGIEEGKLSSLKQGILATAYWCFESPYLYGIPARIPALGLGETHCSLDYQSHGLSPMQAAAALAQLNDCLRREEQLRKSANLWSELLTELPLVQPYVERANEGNVPTRYPLILSNTEQRDRVLRSLLEAGLGASSSYPSVLNDYPELRPFIDGDRVDAARSISGRILTLPSHVYVGDADREKTLRILRNSLRER
jgi:dTDP-4-amino-4,6-dideoxygalactose transaminase